MNTTKTLSPMSASLSALRSFLTAVSMTIMCAISVSIFAESIDIYEYHSLVATQTRPERNQATADGLAEVFVRASGQPSVLRDPGVMKALSGPSTYLVEYRYQSSDEMIVVDNKNVPAWDLILKFSGASIEKLLRELQLPIWSTDRPSLMVWLAIDQSNSKKIVSKQYSPEGLAAIQSASAQRGLPVKTPKGDLDDQVALSADKLWQLDERSIQSATERYKTDSILVGRLTQTTQSRWRASWLLVNENRSKTFESNGTDLNSVVAGGMGQTADYFFSLYGYAPTGGEQQTFTFSVTGISDFSRYAAAMKYIQDLPVVRGVDVVAVVDDRVILRVASEADLRALDQAISLGKKLVKDYQSGGDGVSGGSDTNPVKYTWR